MGKAKGACVALAALLTAGCGRYGYDLLSRSDPQVGSGPGDAGRPDGSVVEPGDGADGEPGPPDGSAPGDGAFDGDGADGGGSTSDAAVQASACPAALDPEAVQPRHRYQFERTDTLVEDSVSLRHGSTTGASQGGGVVTVSGAGSYVQLPSGLVTVLPALTVMLWVRWDSGPQNQTVFDFGQSAQNRLRLLASSPGQGMTLALETGSESVSLSTNTTLTVGAFQQIAVELEPATGRVALSKNGTLLVSNSGVRFDLANLRDDNVWLGRSNGGDQPFQGAYEELRLYDRALGPCAIAQASSSGAQNTLFSRCADPGDNCDYVQGTGGWKCDVSRSFAEAATRCAVAGMRLVTIDDAGQNQALVDAANGSALYVGLHDPDGSGAYRWCDGSPPSFSALPAAPDGEDCVTLEPDGSWRTLPCTSGRPYACEPD